MKAERNITTTSMNDDKINTRQILFILFNSIFILVDVCFLFSLFDSILFVRTFFSATIAITQWEFRLEC